MLWYVKWTLASYAVAFGIFLLAFIVSLPFVGPALVDAVIEHGVILVLVMLAVPVGFRFLR